MKLTSLFLIISLFQIHANSSYGQNTKITLNLQNVSVEKVLNRIEALTDYKFIYKDKEVNYKKTVTIIIEKEPISEVLEVLFSDTNIESTPVSPLFCSLFSFSQVRRVHIFKFPYFVGRPYSFRIKCKKPFLGVLGGPPVAITMKKAKGGPFPPRFSGSS